MPRPRSGSGAGEVVVGRPVIEQPGDPLDAHLPVQVEPEQLRRTLGVGGQLLALVTVAIGEEHEPRRRQLPEEDGARVDALVDAQGRHRHRRGFANLRFGGLVEPAPQLDERVGGGSGLVETTDVVVVALALEGGLGELRVDAGHVSRGA